ncbi:unknown [Streptomyces phage mu1/6]|uniref:hypothetical protein n=1 Tax=Streptomyces phage mu1/6 TaxID=370623 RepID=UPI0000D4F6C9|nr:hypothetical protein SPMV1_gp27 [Streptomyces phage mu1/6]ABD94192.1 unknown [Streptomyces phage mu1/6]
MSLIVLAICGPGSLVGILWLGAIRGEQAEAERDAAEQRHFDTEFARIVDTWEHQP